MLPGIIQLRIKSVLVFSRSYILLRDFRIGSIKWSAGRFKSNSGTTGKSSPNLDNIAIKAVNYLGSMIGQIFPAVIEKISIASYNSNPIPCASCFGSVILWVKNMETVFFTRSADHQPPYAPG